ncbi:uncharacterized protein BO97DRAFT_279590 [Aspergillus homomorphus CBS 101889]|uniref:Uncharacterized protein n=1 Tax=Aspergillus homomorphus (strain CBS 101889) TaxID=1450537 RepID=A0A395HG14_ASPHC|nr:hypothetical protein BO97DRAFT_279590 [Aspergillus homomorphus CBS 101889]RAL06797.1 hypothetical protein BO97DRAFT_279590 [Aspergillus homomorphus CBS 101889]
MITNLSATLWHASTEMFTMRDPSPPVLLPEVLASAGTLHAWASKTYLRALKGNGSTICVSSLGQSWLLGRCTNDCVGTPAQSWNDNSVSSHIMAQHRHHVTKAFPLINTKDVCRSVLVCGRNGEPRLESRFLLAVRQAIKKLVHANLIP